MMQQKEINHQIITDLLHLKTRIPTQLDYTIFILNDVIDP